MNEIEEFIQAFKELLDIPDTTFELLKVDIISQLKLSFHNEPTTADRIKQLEQLRLQKKPIADIENQIQSGINAFDELCDNLKQSYTSPAKQEFLDVLKSEFAKLQRNFIESYKQEQVIIPIQLLHPNAKIPTYANFGDQGADLYAPEDITIAPHTYGNLVKLGIACAIPAGWALGIRPRSGMSKKTTLRLSNCYGTIDTSYKDEIGVLFDNIGDEPYTILAGDRIAQLILERNYNADFEIVNNVHDYGEDRGGGFGHTGE